MQGTEEVRRQAEDRVRELVEKFEGEAAELARARAKDQLEAESDRIRKQAEQREERARRAAEEEIKASANKARREALAAADADGALLGRAARAAVDLADQRLPDLLGAARRKLRPAMREVRIKDTLSGELRRDRCRRRGRHLRLRPDRLQPHPHRQRPPLRRLLAVRPLPALGGLRGEARHQRHRHQRQDLRGRRGGGRALGRVRRPDDERLLRGHRPARPRAARRRAARLARRSTGSSP